MFIRPRPWKGPYMPMPLHPANKGSRGRGGCCCPWPAGNRAAWPWPAVSTAIDRSYRDHVNKPQETVVEIAMVYECEQINEIQLSFEVLALRECTCHSGTESFRIQGAIAPRTRSVRIWKASLSSYVIIGVKRNLRPKASVVYSILYRIFRLLAVQVLYTKQIRYRARLFPPEV